MRLRIADRSALERGRKQKIPKVVRFGRSLSGTSPWTPTSNPPRPSLLRGRFGIEIGSNQEIDI